MNSQILGLRVAGAVFGLMALAQLGRLVARPEVLVAGHVMPLWPSALAFVIFAGLCFWMWTLAGTTKPQGDRTP
jgi:nucleoside recognition membrane protein YjiH